LVILAPLFWREANSWNTIGGAALALLVWRPGNLFDPSFQLTFLSVLAIVAFAVPLLVRLNQIGSWRPTRVTPFPPDCAPWIRCLAEALFWSERKWHAEISNSNVTYRLFKVTSAKTFERWHLQGMLRFGFSAIVVSLSVQVFMLPLLVLYFHRLSIAAL